MIGRNRRRTALLMLLLLFSGILCGRISAQAATERASLFDQVKIRMPEISVYYRGRMLSAPEAWLSGEPLTLLSQQQESQTEEPLIYEILLDCSDSISGEEFRDLRKSLLRFRGSLRQGDRMKLYSYGDSVREVLCGTESEEEAEAILENISGGQKGRCLCQCVEEAAARRAAEDGRTVLILISGDLTGKDEITSFSNAEEQVLRSGKSLHILQICPTARKAGSMTDLAERSGGSVQYPNGIGAETALQNIHDSMLLSWRAVFLAENTIASGRGESFLMAAGEDCQERTVYPMFSREDTEPPEILLCEWLEDNRIRICFSENMEGLCDTSHYVVNRRTAGESREELLPVLQVIRDENSSYGVELVFGETLGNGDYRISFPDLHDTSAQKNILTEKEQTLKIRTSYETNPSATPSPTPTPAPLPVSEEPVPDGPAYDPGEYSAGSRTALFAHPLVLLCAGILATLLAGFLFLLSFRGMRLPMTLYYRSPESSGEQKTVSFSLRKACVVGRSSSCDISFDDPGLSRKHFRILREDDSVLQIEDLHTANGTKLNGQPLTAPAALKPGDLIEAGSSRFHILWDAEKKRGKS